MLFVYVDGICKGEVFQRRGSMVLATRRHSSGTLCSGLHFARRSRLGS
jgi:hypothetical protein